MEFPFSLSRFRQCAAEAGDCGSTRKLRGRRILCQQYGPDNEILSDQLKEIRWANDQADFERLINRFRRLKVPSSRPQFNDGNGDRNSKTVTIRKNPFLRPVAGTALAIPTGYESDAQLLAVIQSSNAGEVHRGRKWWPNGMTCEEFRDIRRQLFTSPHCCRSHYAIPSGIAKQFVGTIGKRCQHSHDECHGKNQHQENKHHYVQVGNQRDSHSSDGEDGASDNNNGEHLNKGFHWRVNFLLKLSTVSSSPSSFADNTASSTVGPGSSLQAERHLVALRSNITTEGADE